MVRLTCLLHRGRICTSRIPAFLGLSFFSLAVSSQWAFAGVIYTYAGNNFNLFSCGPDINGVQNLLCSIPDPAFTSYTTADFVSATLALSELLPGNLTLQDVRGFAGFSLTMTDGHQEMTLNPGVPGEALVSTDPAGNIIGPWSVFVNCCFFPNNNIFSLNWPGGRGIGDGGGLSVPQGDFPDTPRDQGLRFDSPGVWTTISDIPEPSTFALLGLGLVALKILRHARSA